MVSATEVSVSSNQVVQHDPRSANNSVLGAVPSSTDGPHVTVFVRLPFPRGGFKDPSPVNWDASKERALWKLLSQTSGEGNVDWEALARTFDVSLPFLLRQAAWLYERQLSQVKAQMRRVGRSSASNAASPTPDPPSSGGYPMKRGGSGSTMPRIPSTISMRSKDGSRLKGEGLHSHSSTKPFAPPMTRVSSNTTVQAAPSSPQLQNRWSHRSSSPQRTPSQRPARFETVPRVERLSATGDGAITTLREAPSGDSSSSSEVEHPMSSMHSQAFKRPPPFLSSRTHTLLQRVGEDEGSDHNDDVDDDDDQPAFLPRADLGSSRTPNIGRPPSSSDARPKPSSSKTEPIMFRPPVPPPSPRTSDGYARTVHSSGSSASSYHTLAVPSTTVTTNINRPTTTSMTALSAASDLRRPSPAPSRGPLSPRRTIDLSRRSPGQRGVGPGIGSAARPGSDGTPSMGSSFSDLDDTSITQSALEEALLSHMHHAGDNAGSTGGAGVGSMASRMSTISQALRSRYL